MKKEQLSSMAGYERIASMYEKMNSDERLALQTWEKENVRGDGTLGSSDWPGWVEVTKRLSH